MEQRIEPLETAIDYRFSRPELLRLALTHRSSVHEGRTHEGRQHDGLLRPEPLPPEPSREAAQPRQITREDNETLEFLGDAVVGLVTAEVLFRRYPELSEGSLTRLRGALVSRRHLATVAEAIGLGSFLRLGRGEERSGGRAKTALLANAMEAVVAAIYLDGGLEPARRLIEARVVAPSVADLRARLTAADAMGDFKSALQEILQARHQGQPEYRKIRETGPDHRKHFEVEVLAGGQVLGAGEGPTRKYAEQDAARKALARLEGKDTPRSPAAEEPAAENFG